MFLWGYLRDATLFQRDYKDNLHDRRLQGITHPGAVRHFTYVTTPENRIEALTESAPQGSAPELTRQFHRVVIEALTESAPQGSAWPVKAWSYHYDAADRLLRAEASDGIYGYDYDPGDNLLELDGPAGGSTIEVNAVNQITAFDAQAYVYDANGDLIDDGRRSYQWDAAHRLLRIDYPAQPNRHTRFRYDGLGRRTAILSDNGAFSTETRYLWCGDTLCQARNGDDTVIRRYYAEGEVRPQGNTRLYYSRDHLGSVRDVQLLPAGTRIAATDYDPYGNVIRGYGRLVTDFRHAGMFFLQDAGLYLTRYRVYDPAVGRWISRDPIGEAGGVNLYAYVEGDPVNWVDPLGLQSTSEPIRIPIPGFPIPGPDENNPSPSKGIGDFLDSCLNVVEKWLFSPVRGDGKELCTLIEQQTSSCVYQCPSKGRSWKGIWEFGLPKGAACPKNAWI